MTKATVHQPLLGLLIFFLIVLMGVIVARASLMEDAYITFRVLDNFVNGYGLRWNLHERVQVYTNPLWLLVHIPFYAAYRNIFFDTLMVSLICTEIALCAVLLTFKKPHLQTICLFLLPLTLSRSFTVYSASGFENALEHLLFAVFGGYVMRGDAKTKIFAASLCVSLSMVNRLDTVMLYAPFFAYYFWTQKITLRPLILGFLPIIAWELFSLLYYGFLFPNTKYAKLNTGVDPWEYLQLGISYLLNLFTVDFASGCIVLAALATAPLLLKYYRLTKDDNAGIVLSVICGIVLYMAYVVAVGGTYLSGRMFSLSIFASAWVLLATSGCGVRPYRQLMILAALSVTTLFPPPLSWLKHQCPACFRGVDDINAEVKDGLWDVISGKVIVPEPSSVHKKEPVILEWSMGKWGYSLERGVKVVDGFAIVDPLLARLPMMGDRIATMGMTTRAIPQGYMEAVATGSTAHMDPDLAQYYEKLRIVVSDDVWSITRLKEVLYFNLGAYDYLLKHYIQKQTPAK